MNNKAILAGLAFFIQFPLEFLYSFITTFYLGTLYSYSLFIPKIILFFLLLVYTIKDQLRDFRINRYILLTYTLILVITISTILGTRSLGMDADSGGMSIRKYYFEVIFLYVYMFLIGYNFDLNFFNKKLVLGTFLLMVFFVFINTDFSTLLLDYEKAIVEEASKNYLFLADSFSFFSILVVAVFRSPKDSRSLNVHALLITTACLVLAFLWSRTTFYIFVVLTLVYLILLQSRKARFFTMAALFTLFCVSILFLREQMISSRMFSLILSTEDASLNSRLFMFLDGFSDIYSNPVFGNFGGQIKSFGFIGFYIHNIFSFWRQFGIISIAILIALIGPMIKTIYLILLKLKNQRYYVVRTEFFLYFISMIIVISLTFSRSFNYPYIFLIVGLFSQYKTRLID